MFKDIPGYEGLYQVSDTGKVKSLSRITTYMLNGKEVRRTERERLLKASLSRSDSGRRYYAVILSKDGEKKFFRVHRLVALAHIPNPLGLPVVDHIDRDKLNNAATNLRWVTHEDNLRHG